MRGRQVVAMRDRGGRAGAGSGPPPPDDDDGSRQPGPLGLSTRRRAYFALMGVCLVLIVLSWTLIWRFSILAAVIMSVIALFIPPVAAVVANASPANRQ